MEPNKEEKQQIRGMSPAPSGDFAGISLPCILLSDEALLNHLKLLSQRDYLLESVLITTKCFQLQYNVLELENQNSPRFL